MDTRCHRTTTTLSLPSLPSSNLAHSFNRGKKSRPVPVGLTQITCPPQFVLDALYARASKAEESGIEGIRRVIFSLSCSLHDYVNYRAPLHEGLVLESRSFRNSSNERGNILFRGREENWKTFSFEKMIIGQFITRFILRNSCLFPVSIIIYNRRESETRLPENDLNRL